MAGGARGGGVSVEWGWGGGGADGGFGGGCEGGGGFDGVWGDEVGWFGGKGGGGGWVVEDIYNIPLVVFVWHGWGKKYFSSICINSIFLI